MDGCNRVCAVVLALMRPLGIYIARVLEGEKTFLDPALRPVERLIYRVSGVNAGRGNELAPIHRRHAALQLRLAVIHLRHPARATLSAAESAGPSGVAPDLAFNTAVSFTTNTNWQS